jgi:hypothetical protein
MAGRHLQPDPDAGDVNTIGGYVAVHARPAAFEGSDGMSYSVSIEADATGDADRPFGAYFLFLRWRRMGAQGVEGHLESPFLAYASTADEAKRALGAWSLNEVKATLDALVREAASGTTVRRWWDVMREEP